MGMVPEKIIPQNIMLMPNAERPQAAEMGQNLEAYLQHEGLKTKLFSLDFDQPSNLPDLSQTDLIIAIGGDGTLLRAGHMAAPLGIPLLGVQAGRLGFLAELDNDDWQLRMAELLKGQFRLEKRMMLDAVLHRSGQKIKRWDVINEIVVSRGRFVRPIDIRVDLNEGYLTSYNADGMIVSTATGSTAYALACGGPILPPELRNMLILPIAPHLSLDRAVVLAEGATVTLRTNSDHEAVLSVDGMDPVKLFPEDRIQVSANDHSLSMVRFGEANYFYRNLIAVIQNNPINRTETNE
jgi:NAD+ kinase